MRRGWRSERLELSSYVKTSGADGIHVLVPIARRATYERTYAFAERVARSLEERHPGLVTTEWLKKKREGVLVDHRQNARGKTIASVYSVRPKPGAPVSTPLLWEELTEDVTPRRFGMREDCRSTVALHEWLLSLRPPDTPWRSPPDERERSEEAEERDAERAALRDALLDGAVEGDPRWLLAQLLSYHRREGRPQWHEWFDHVGHDDDELIEDTDTIGGLELVGEPEVNRQSLVYPLSFPEQEHKVDHRAVDPKTGKSYKVAVDDELGLVRLWRGKNRAEEPLPTALIPPKPIDDYDQRNAVARFARSYRDGDGRYAAVRDILERRRPRARLDASPVDAALSLDGSYLFVQGPPGSGKTWQGAKIAVALMGVGQRVGITSLSHKAINKLLTEVEREAREQGFSFSGVKKHTHEENAFEGQFIEPRAEWRDCCDPRYQLVAGTSWLLAREEFDGTLDTLIVDEGGQVALADAIALGTCARNIVLLGDPNQLPQVSQAAQPEAAKASVLQHLLGDDETVPADRGIFLEHTRRLRPELCRFTSEAYYEGRLRPSDDCALRTLGDEDGLAVIRVDHAGRSQSSPEEAAAVAAEIGRLLGTPFTDEHGTTGPLTEDDVLVVAPYNAQVRALRAKVPAGVRVGTVDKFQGQEAPVAIVSLASSTGEEAPRGIGFVFQRNRINVATSRAQCRVVLVCSPRLLEADCKTVEQMRLANALCRFVELADVPRG
jgi:uncharacterized protein